MAAAGCGLLAGALLRFVAQRVQPHERILRPANVITLTRVAGAALLAGTAAAPMVGRRAALLALLWGGPSDWIDGPVARRLGATPLGAVLDIEADSWLTLWAAFAAWRTGGLASSCLVTPALRYLIPCLQLTHRRRPRPDRSWQRLAASLQTLSLVLALAPNDWSRQRARMVGPFGVAAQLMAMASSARSLVRGDS